MSVEIYLSDLNAAKREEVLRESGCGPDDNWETAPLAILEFEDE